MDKLRNWIDDRTGYRNLLHAVLLLNFPVSRGARWRYVWGGSLALMFIVELVTGTLLMTVYSPSEASAWGSVQYLETEVTWGWFIRGVHHYTSHMMLIVILLHTLLVVLTAGYRKPKEFTFWSGLVLGGVILALAISGNPLPWDQKGYWAYQIETSIAGTMPVIGSALRTLLVGGSQFGNLTLTRLYTLHVVVLPVLAIFLLVIHVVLMRREKLRLETSLKPLPIVSKDSNAESTACVTSDTEPYWPYQTTRNLLMFTALMAIVVAQVVVYPQLKEKYAPQVSDEWQPDLPLSEITLEAPADSTIPYVARPEWYVRFLFELRHKLPKEKEVLVTAFLPLAIVFFLFLMPFYEKVLTPKFGYAFSVTLTVAGMVAIFGLTFSGVRKERTDAEYQATRRREINYAARAVWLARQNGIPPEGPTTLLQNDAKAMGPLLFAANCAGCHTWNGHDGTGKRILETVDGKKVAATPTASDLYGFGTAEWIAGFLANPQGEKYFGHLDRLSGGEDIKDGEMAGWAEENIAPDGPLEPKHLEAVAALLAAEANRPDDKPASKETLKLGVAVFSGAELKATDGKPLEFEGNCLECHQLKAGDPNAEGEGESPNLNGYASSEWLTDFIRNPADERFYGETNAMPAYDEAQLNDRDLTLLVQWMRGEWVRPNHKK